MTKTIMAIHPGEYIRDELEARGWIQSDLAEIMNRPEKIVNQIICGKNGITVRTANELSLAFGTSAELWLSLQSRFDIATSDHASDEIRKKSRLFDLFPVRELEKRGWIKPWSDSNELETNLCDFWETQAIDDIDNLSFAAKKTNENEPFNHAHLLWVWKAIKLSRSCTVDSFSTSKIKKYLPELHALTAHESEARKVPSVLAKMGIKFVVVKHLAGTKIDGAAIWITKKQPLIAVSLRYDRIDNFWHAIFHEVSHVLNGDETVVDIDVTKTNPNLESEIRANQDASRWLVDSELIDSFVSRCGSRISRVKVNQFANLHQIHPGIVVGQLHFRGVIDYSKLRAMLTPIRDIVSGHSISDGWD